MDEEKQRILVVDDEPLNIQVLAAILGFEHKIIVASDGEQALKRASATTPPDLILLDIQMPNMDGYEVCRRLKADPITKEIPVIFVTARSSEGDEEAGLRLGAIDYITKPFSPAIVRIRVENHLELKRQRTLLAQLNITDGLTGIPNRRRFDEFLEKSWQIAVRNGTLLSLALLDIDHFKPYNDHYGHPAGDACLRQVAQSLLKTTGRATDLIARYGGEEFAAILPGTDLQGALRVTEQMRSSVEAMALPHGHSSASSLVTVSIGTATILPTASDHALSLLQFADAKLYSAKSGGRNRVVGETMPTPSP